VAFSIKPPSNSSKAPPSPDFRTEYIQNFKHNFIRKTFFEADVIFLLESSRPLAIIIYFLNHQNTGSRGRFVAEMGEWGLRSAKIREEQHDSCFAKASGNVSRQPRYRGSSRDYCQGWSRQRKEAVSNKMKLSWPNQH
jgi:hypothetical protein